MGLEGFWGCVYYSILLPIFQNVSCSNENLCPNGVIEDSKLAFQQMSENHTLIAQSIGIIFSIACFNACGVAITKYASAAQRSTIDTCRTLLIWIVSIAQGQEDFLWGELFGFVLLVGGTLVYNEIVILPGYFGKNTKREIEKRERGDKGILDEDTGKPNALGGDPNYVALSPGAVYDSQRNNRAIGRAIDQRNDLLDKHNKADTYGSTDIDIEPDDRVNKSGR